MQIVPITFVNSPGYEMKMKSNFRANATMGNLAHFHRVQFASFYIKSGRSLKPVV